MTPPISAKQRIAELRRRLAAARADTDQLRAKLKARDQTIEHLQETVQVLRSELSMEMTLGREGYPGY